MSANLYVGRADMEAVLRLARREEVDVLVLEEAGEDALRRLDRAGGRAAFPRRAGDRSFNVILTRRALRPRFGSVGGDVAALVTVDRRDVRVVAVHPLPPVSEANVASWRSSLRGLPSVDGSGPLTILAGDFNATLDHRELRAVIGRGYRDAADVVGAGLRPTWPDGRSRPPIAIDHVLADRRLAVRRFAVHDLRAATTTRWSPSSCCRCRRRASGGGSRSGPRPARRCRAAS
jgi:endonuclease/exonuclease/phosphatase family metal-dependent hydrolase